MQKGANIKKLWLVSLVLMCVLKWLICCGIVLDSNTTATHDQTLGVVFILFPLLWAIPFAIFYHCAYKKGGTKLLGFQIIAGTIKFLTGTFEGLKNGVDIKDVILGAIIILPVSIFYLINSIRLYDFNKANKQLREN